jgi:septal ring factor EnvC (AmiA/AmiB activator)
MRFYVLSILLAFTFTEFSAFSSIESDLNRVAKDCRHSEAEVAQLESQLEDVKSLYQEKTAHLLMQQKKIARLILLLRSLKAEAPSRIIQADKDSKHVLHNFSILQCYIRHLHKQMHNLQIELSTLKQTKEETSSRKAALGEKLSIYQKKYTHLEKLLKQNKEQIQKTLSQRKEKEEKAKQLAARSTSLTELIKHLEKEQTSSKQRSSSSLDFSLLSPVQGPLLINFNQKHSQNPDGSGVVFRARAGSHVLAPISGKVLYAGSFRRYHKILIIGFRKTYSLLLTGLERLDVSVGQEVRVGDPIGRLSEENKNYLYLELRNHGIPIKPHIMKI